MHSAFSAYIQQERLFGASDRILLALSGGIDSVVMCDLFHRSQLNFAIAHCNFGLRGGESDADEAFVEALAERYNVPFHSTTFHTKAIAKKQKQSLQAAARELRYSWFESLSLRYRYNYIATAHHRDDSVETFLHHLVRGTGIAGLHGILPKQGKVVRPLLFATKPEIIAYAKRRRLEYREDSSNAGDAYLRNRIRHHLVPLLKELNPAAEKNIAEEIAYMRDAESIYQKEIERQRKRLVRTEKQQVVIPLAGLQKLQPLQAYLYEFLKPYQFKGDVVKQIIAALAGGSGKQFFSGTHRLVKDREALLIAPLAEPEEEIAVKENDNLLSLDEREFTWKIAEKKENFKIPTAAETVALDAGKLRFPLLLRKWRKGDTFRPIGMKGKKKLSDLFIDLKLSLPEKERVWLLESGGEIAWVIGYRPAEPFKVTPQTRKIFLAELRG